MFSKEYRKVISIWLHLNGEQLPFISPRTAHWLLIRLNICFISCQITELYVSLMLAIDAYHDLPAWLLLRMYCSLAFEWNDPLRHRTQHRRRNLFIAVSPLAAQWLARSGCAVQTLFVGWTDAHLFSWAEAKSHTSCFICIREMADVSIIKPWQGWWAHSLQSAPHEMSSNNWERAS